MPPFMFRGGQGPPAGNYPPPGPYQAGGGGYQGSGQQQQRGGGRYPPPSEGGRYRQGPARAMAGGGGDPGELYPRPIIKEEDLRRMDEISTDDGWAALQDEPDYDKKLFNDEDEAPKPAPATSNNKSAVPPVQEDERADRDGKWADNIQVQGRVLSNAPTTATGPTAPVQLLSRDRPMIARRGDPQQQQQQQPAGRHATLDEEEFWKEQQQRQKSFEMKAALRAQQMRSVAHSLARLVRLFVNLFLPLLLLGRLGTRRSAGSNKTNWAIVTGTLGPPG